MIKSAFNCTLQSTQYDTIGFISLLGEADFLGVREADVIWRGHSVWDVTETLVLQHAR